MAIRWRKRCLPPSRHSIARRWRTGYGRTGHRLRRVAADRFRRAGASGRRLANVNRVWFRPYSWTHVMESPPPKGSRPTDTGHMRQDANVVRGAVGTHMHLPRPHSMNSSFSAREVERRTTWTSVTGRVPGVYTFDRRTGVLPHHGRRSPDAPSPALSVRQTLTSRRCTKNMGPTLEHCDFTPYGLSRRYGVFLFTARGVPQRIARRRAPCGSLPPVSPGGSAADLSCATRPCRPADRLQAPVARCSRQPDLSHNLMQGRPR